RRRVDDVICARAQRREAFALGRDALEARGGFLVMALPRERMRTPRLVEATQESFVARVEEEHAQRGGVAQLREDARHLAEELAHAHVPPERHTRDAAAAA